MIIAQYKNILKYLHDAIDHRNIATVGYYIGGMKEQALKATEGKKVVISTYAMAAKALDIKTLTTFIIATPKTDIEQSVGRILREKHSSPVVVDIVDRNDLFQNQWRKKTFYKKENYKIFYTNSANYTPDTSKWLVVFNPSSSEPQKCEKEHQKMFLFIVIIQVIKVLQMTQTNKLKKNLRSQNINTWLMCVF